ncbi:MAG: ACT domain-containing protein [Desulfobacterales bacterium]|jgi:hypothetical protein
MTPVEQISIFLENKAGRLAEVTGILAEAGINIRALALADTSEFGVMRLIVDDHQRARIILKDQGVAVATTEVVAVNVADRPGGLHEILKTLYEGGINVEYMYAFVQHSGSRAVMIFRFDKVPEALALLGEQDVEIIAAETLYTL